MQIDSVAIEKHITVISQQYSAQLTPVWLLVCSGNQCLYIIDNNNVERNYSISTSKYGLGQQQDSYKTPLGAHIIEQKIGAQCGLNEILRARLPTGEYAEIINDAIASQQDLILSRILWLKGLEAGKNLGEGIDSKQRYIYIHGTQEEGMIGEPASHGCIRMKNKDVIELYERVVEGTFVYIV